MKVDFHVHSTASDGTVPPERLALRAMVGGFRAIAISDHDNCDGTDAFVSARYDPAEAESLLATRQKPYPKPNPAVPRIKGIELSIEPGVGYGKFHLLGLGIDPENSKLKALLKRILEGRNGRNDRIIENFERLGIHIPKDDIKEYAHGEVLARPHFANWLVKHGYSDDIASAFAKYLLPESPAETRAYEERWHPPQEEAFDAIHSAGGICVMAHPKYWRIDWRDAGPDPDVAAKELSRLKEIGLDGMEAMYQANKTHENIAWSMLADRVGLLKSAGSDYHGSNKPNIRLGMDVEEFFIAPLLERLGI